MKNTDISQLFGVPFGAQADSTTIATIPATKTAIGRASMALGFPKENFQPLDNGGQPVSGADLNGILNILARSAQAAELGVLHPFSESYSEAIGGYPAGATVAHPTIAGRFLVNTWENNGDSPSNEVAGWVDPLAAFQPAGDYATTAALATETQRAEQAEAGLLPLSGGALTGTVTGSVGGVVPQVLGITGRVVFQNFLCTNSSNQVVTFPTPFAPGTVPVVMVGAQDPNSPALASVLAGSITNTSFRIGSFWAGGSAGFNWAQMGADTAHPLAVFAMGVL